MITNVSASGITGTEIDIDSFFAELGIDRDGFNRAATGHLAMLVTGETDEIEFDLVPGDAGSRVKLSQPEINDGGHEIYAHLGGKLVTVRLDTELAS